MTTNRLTALHDAGQSVWLDFIDRTILRNGELARKIRDDALSGMTSNPTIFEKALAEGDEYDDQIISAPPGTHRLGPVRAGGDYGRPHGVRHFRGDVSRDKCRRWVRLDRGIAWRVERHGGVRRRSASALGYGRPA
jgi:hypothetical protein